MLLLNILRQRRPTVGFVLLLVGVYIAGYLTHPILRYAKLAWKISHRKPHTHHQTQHHSRQLSLGSSNNAAASNEGEQASGGSCGECTTGLCDLDDLSALESTSLNLQLFNLTLPCEGKIVAWRFIDQNAEVGQSFQLSVVHIESDLLYLDGVNKISTTGAKGWTTFQVPESEQISVDQRSKIVLTYDSEIETPIIPSLRKPTSTITKQQFYDVVEFEVTSDELELLVEVGEPAPAPVSKILEEMKITVQKNWGIPAIQIVIGE